MLVHEPPLAPGVNLEQHMRETEAAVVVRAVQRLLREGSAEVLGQIAVITPHHVSAALRLAPCALSCAALRCCGALLCCPAMALRLWCSSGQLPALPGRQ